MNNLQNMRTILLLTAVSSGMAILAGKDSPNNNVFAHNIAGVDTDVSTTDVLAHSVDDADIDALINDLFANNDVDEDNILPVTDEFAPSNEDKDKTTPATVVFSPSDEDKDNNTPATDVFALSNYDEDNNNPATDVFALINDDQDNNNPATDVFSNIDVDEDKDTPATDVLAPSYDDKGSNTASADMDNARPTWRIIQGPKVEEMASKGANVTISCKVENGPQSSVRWEFNNTKIIQGTKYMINHHNGDLVVKNVDLEDQGTYRCLVGSEGSVEDFREGTLVVKNETTIVAGPKDFVAPVWSMVTMNCTVLYNMEEILTVTWFKDGRRLGGVDYQQEDISFGRNTHYGLMLRNVTMDDAGNYTCLARTNSSEHNITGNLEVFGIPPSVGKIEALEVLEGNSVIVDCSVLEGYPAPVISWYKDDVILEGERENTLTIKDAAMEQSGLYKCVAINTAGEVSEEAIVDVRKKTAIESTAESFVYNEGEDVVINCQVTVDPNLERYLTVTWFRGQTQLDNLPKVQPIFGGGVEGAQLNVFQMYEEGSGSDEDEYKEDHIVLMANNSLKIFNMKEEDLGEYNCKAIINKNELEDLVISGVSKIYLEASFPWWIIVIPFIIIIIAVILVSIVICRLRKALAVKGNYNVSDIEGNTKKLKKTDIYYLPSDLDYDAFINSCTPTPGQTPCCGTRNSHQQLNSHQQSNSEQQSTQRNLPHQSNQGNIGKQSRQRNFDYPSNNLTGHVRSQSNHPATNMHSHHQESARNYEQLI